MGLEMKEKMVIINVLYLDDDNVELTCNTLLTEKKEFDINKVISGDVMHMRRKMVQASPKVYKLVVGMDFYKRNNLNILKYVDLEVNV